MSREQFAHDVGNLGVKAITEMLVSSRSAAADDSTTSDTTADA
jgi:hypothetical protein